MIKRLWTMVVCLGLAVIFQLTNVMTGSSGKNTSITIMGDGPTTTVQTKNYGGIVILILLIVSFVLAVISLVDFKKKQ